MAEQLSKKSKAVISFRRIFEDVKVFGTEDLKDVWQASAVFQKLICKLPQLLSQSKTGVCEMYAVISLVIRW